jgi:hypothetical protein
MSNLKILKRRLIFNILKYDIGILVGIILALVAIPELLQDPLCLTVAVAASAVALQLLILRWVKKDYRFLLKKIEEKQ